jgi:endoglucanase
MSSRHRADPTRNLMLTRRSVCAALALAAGARVSWSADRTSEGLAYAGVNLAGGEFGTVPGAYAKDYIYPSPADIDYYAQLGFNLIRVPFRWERLQPALNAPFNSADQALLLAAVAHAASNGLSVVLDTHNYARRRLADDGWTKEHLIGSDEVPTAAFVDYCARLANLFKDNPSVIFGLMNEPWGLPAQDWLTIANAAIAAVRAAGAPQLILVPGVAYTGAHSWITSGNTVMAKTVDPANRFAFEAHQYLDTDSSGTSAIAVGPRVGSERIEAFQNWCRQNGFKAFLGEFAAGEDANSLAALTDICRTLQANPDVWLGWAAWAGGSWWPDDYIFKLDPTKTGQTRPQTEILAGFARQRRR